MVNNNHNNNDDDDDDGGGKLPPIEYCQQPSQAEAYPTASPTADREAAMENSDRYVDKANDRWRTGHTVPAKNPTGMGMRYDEPGTERKVVYNKKGISLPPPNLPEGYQQRCNMAGCKNDQLLTQLPCWNYHPDTHARMLHRHCYQKLLDKHDLVHPDPNQRISKMKYMHYGACTKGCHVAMEKYLANNNVDSLPFEEDGKTGRDDPKNSASIIMDWISIPHNYDRYTGASDKKHAKVYYENEIAHAIAEAGVRKKRTGKDVKNFIGRKLEAWKRTFEWVNNTGQGLKEAGEHQQFKDAVLAKCPHYYVMEPVLGARAGVKPIMNSDTAHLDDDVSMGTDDTDGGRDSSGGEERRRNDREEQARFDPEDRARMERERAQIERVQIDSAKKLSLEEADARSLDNQFDAHMVMNVDEARAKIARVKDEHDFDMPTPRPVGGTIDLSGSFSSSAASNKGGNAAVAAITASANNSAKKMLFPKANKKKAAGSVASLSKKKFTSAKKRRSSLSSVSTMATSSLSRSRGFSSTTRDKNEKDDVMLLQHMVEQGKAKELRKLQMQAADEVRTQKLFDIEVKAKEIEVKAKEAQAAAQKKQAEAEERKAEAEELARHNRMEREDAAFFFELLKSGMPKGQIKSFYPRLSKFCST